MKISNHKKPTYAAPRLTVYGAFLELTLTASISKNMNDAIQGMNNLKT